MPYKIKHRGSGYKVTTPNHPQGFSKHPLSKSKATAQLRAIKMNTNEELAEQVVDVLLDEVKIDPEELRKGAKDEEEEHDMPPKLARKTARQHLTRVDPHYYTKTEKCLGESQSCECTDPGCPVCGGKCNRTAQVNMNRADMADESGVFFCRQCAGDAADAGVFGPHSVKRFIRYHGRTPRLKTAPKADIMPGGSLGTVGGTTGCGGGISGMGAGL